MGYVWRGQSDGVQCGMVWSFGIVLQGQLNYHQRGVISNTWGERKENRIVGHYFHLVCIKLVLGELDNILTWRS